MTHPTDPTVSRNSDGERRFEHELQVLVDAFPSNQTCRRLDAGDFSVEDYHRFLEMIVHQVRSSSRTFEAAARNMTEERAGLRAYLFHHAEEEKDHWQWVLNDLERTGHTGPNPLDEFPPIACASYIAWNQQCAIRGPIWRLANAAYLESLGAHYGKRYAELMCRTLDLQPEQASFLFGHGDTDVGHTEEILIELRRAELDEHEWSEAIHAARVNADLYTRMYEEMSR